MVKEALIRYLSLFRSILPLRSNELVGVDAAGNRYFRQIRGAERRWVKFKNEPDPTAVPVEWTSWLHGRRREAPTPEEIIQLETYRKLVKMKSASINHLSILLDFNFQARSAIDVKMKSAMLEEEEKKLQFKAKSLGQENGVKPPEMNMFIEQVARLEGVSIESGPISSENSYGSSSNSDAHSSIPDTSGHHDDSQEPGGSGDTFRPGTWRPK